MSVPGLVPALVPGLVPALVPGRVPALVPGRVPAIVPAIVLIKLARTCDSRRMKVKTLSTIPWFAFVNRLKFPSCRSMTKEEFDEISLYDLIVIHGVLIISECWKPYVPNKGERDYWCQKV